jgi:glycolate oxidase iron-sulfur subunit
MLEKCSLCGLCKANCPVFKVLRTETVGPRGKAILSKKGVLDEVFYKCTLCKACTVECPLGVDLELEKTRVELVEKRIETEASKKMIKNIRKYGNPFGKVEKGKIPKELYCC